MNSNNKILKRVLKVFLGIFIFFISFGFGQSIKMDSNLLKSQETLNTFINTHKKNLSKVNSDIFDIKSQKENLEKEITKLQENLNKTNESIELLKQ